MLLYLYSVKKTSLFTSQVNLQRVLGEVRQRPAFQTGAEEKGPRALLQPVCQRTEKARQGESHEAEEDEVKGQERLAAERCRSLGRKTWLL